jgi:hypothetical protein
VDAVSTEPVAREPGEQLVLLLDLGKLWPPAALSATVTHRAPPVGDAGADYVATVAVAVMPRTFAAVTLWTSADTDLVKPAGLATRRNKPTAAAEVLKLFAVGLEEAAASPDIIGGG